MFVYNIVLIGFAVSPALSAVRNLATISTCRNLTEATVSRERHKRQSQCGLFQWRCTDGTCIGVGEKCDGKTDCPDRSDETHAQCRIIKRATVSGKCVLPPYPKHGTYVAMNAPDATPGQSFEYAELNVTCEQGYGVVGDAVPYCLDGTWFIPIQKCILFCRLDSDVSVHYNCWVPGPDSYRICNQFEPPGTLVKPECNTPVYDLSDPLLFMTCQNDGRWNRNIIKCKPECGRVTPAAESLLWGGKEAIRGELPWHVAIYKKPTQRSNYYEQICGGSLVSNRIVISAAHCFWDNGKEKKQPASDYAVATAKLFREWDHKDDKDAQKSEIKSIEVTPYYRGVRTNYQHDIAVLILETPFVYYTYVRPVCLDLFDLKFNDLQLQAGNFGKVAGWGLTEANGPTSPVLKVVQLPFLPIPECIRITPPTFTESITGDKICAGYNNGTAAICKGDSGGGLSFPETERGTTRYYLRGVVSTAPRPEGSQACNVFTVTTFTEIYQHRDFIKQFTSTTCTLPPYPEHGFYEVVGNPTVKPGDEVENVYLNVSCNHGHNVHGNNVVLCIRGEWSNKMPECVRDSVTGAACEWIGVIGKCVKETQCLTTLVREEDGKRFACSRNGDVTKTCCTDCELVNNTRNVVIDPHTGINWKDGTKARDSCLGYLGELQYSCREEFQLHIKKNYNEEKQCHTLEISNTGNPYPPKFTYAEYPHQALLGFSWDEDLASAKWNYGGSIISNKYILTSAFVAPNYRSTSKLKFVALGVEKRSDGPSAWQTHKVRRFIPHPARKPHRSYDDIALIETETLITFNRNVMPACLHVEEADVETAIVTTWYDLKTESVDDLTDTIQTVNFVKVTEEECKTIYKPKPRSLTEGIKFDSQMCYASKSPGSCKGQTGQSGEPLLITTQFSRCIYTIIGVTSFGESKCGSNTSIPDVFTRVAHYKPWIESIVWPNF